MQSIFETFYSYLAGLLFVAWFAASIVNQFRMGWWVRLARYDVFGMLPKWTFFAPNPGTYDHHIVFSDRVGGAAGEWKELLPCEVDLRWRWLWNPLRCANKGISDLAGAIARNVQATRDEPLAITVSGSYLSILSVVMSQPYSPALPTARQFAVIRTCGFGDTREVKVAFVSEVHRCEPGS